MTLPYSGYVLQVETVVGGTLPRAGYVQPVEVINSPGGNESLEQARAIGDTFSGGDVYWDNSLAAQFGRASGEANVDYGKIYFDQTSHLFVFDSTKDGAGTLRPMSFQIGGSEAGRFLATKEFLVGTTTLEFSDAICIMRRDQNTATAIYVENNTNGTGAGAAVASVGPDGSGGKSYGQVSYFPPAFTGSGFGVLAGRTALVSGSATGGVVSNPIVIATVQSGDPIIFAPSVTEAARVTSAGAILIGATAPVGSEKLRVVGDAYISGKLTVLGAMDPTSVSLSDPGAGTSLYFESSAGQTAPISAANKGRLRYNNTTHTWQASVNGGAYADFSTGTAGWSQGGNSFGATGVIGTLDNFDINVKTNNATQGAWLKTGEFLVGATALTSHSGDQELVLVKKDQNSSTIIRAENYNTTASGHAEATLAVVVSGNAGGVLLAMGPNAVTANGYGPLDTVFSTYGTMNSLALRTGGAWPIRFILNDVEQARFLSSGVLLLGGVTTQAASEQLRVNGRTYCDAYIQTATGAFLGIGMVPAVPLDIRADVSGTSGNGINYDNRHATGDTYLRIGNNPAGSNSRIRVGYYNGDNTSYVLTSGAGNIYIGADSNVAVIFMANNAEKIRINGTGVGFFTATPVSQQTVGAVTNNVTSGGTDGTIADFTSLTVYATDAPTIRNDIYQLARSVAQLATAVRQLGLAA